MPPKIEAGLRTAAGFFYVDSESEVDDAALHRDADRWGMTYARALVRQELREQKEDIREKIWNRKSRKPRKDQQIDDRPLFIRQAEMRERNRI